MRDFIDLQGASGAAYRFRPWPEGTSHPPMGGNFVYVRQAGEQLTVLRVGETNDLSQARAGWAQARKKGATHVYTRLNVSPQVRAAEHQDLAANHPPPRTRRRQPA
jgi:hypothetical protein